MRSPMRNRRQGGGTVYLARRFYKSRSCDIRKVRRLQRISIPHQAAFEPTPLRRLGPPMRDATAHILLTRRMYLKFEKGQMAILKIENTENTLFETNKSKNTDCKWTHDKIYLLACYTIIPDGRDDHWRPKGRQRSDSRIERS